MGQSNFQTYRKTLNIALQDCAMRRYFPQFSFFRRGKHEAFWIGELQPTDTSRKYTVKVQYHPRYPKVYIIEPELIRNCPHIYPDKSLCLYYPKDRSFTSDKLIAKTIIPWTCEWLFFYEKWIEEGVWWGAEAPHY